MSIRLRMVLTFGLIVAASYLYLQSYLKDELVDQYKFLTEESLVDTVNLAAVTVEQEYQRSGSLSGAALTAYRKRELKAKIGDFQKKVPGLDFYIADRTGKIVFSTRDQDIGQDYSRWNDVYLTLQGKYGARSTHTDPNDKDTSVFFIAAPIRHAGELIGAVSVIKSEYALLSSTSTLLKELLAGIGFIFLVVILFSLLISYWVTGPISQFKDYVNAIRDGVKKAPPQFTGKEMNELLQTFESMRVAIDGHAAVEQYTQNLTHELKSPLTAIRGAAELSMEPMTDVQRQTFLRNIVDEADRARDLLDHLLQISALEAMKFIGEREEIDLPALVNELKVSLAARLESKALQLSYQGDPLINANRFLLTQALRNLIENAIDFCTAGSSINVTGDKGTIRVANQGPQIPEYALNRVFEKFFSLERPDTGKKSTGVGLAFVREVVKLHHGAVTIQNTADGVEVCMDLGS